MRIYNKKIRGHKRIWKDIDAWVSESKQLDVDYLESTNRSHVKVWVSPFSDLNLSRAQPVLPKGETRKKILAGLIEIFNSWEEELKKLNKPYYLAIWLFDKKVHKSQVVCAINSCLDFYETTFYRPEKKKDFPLENYGELSNQLKSFSWEYAWDEDYFTDQDLESSVDEFETVTDYHNQVRWYKRKLNAEPRKYLDKASNAQYYFIKEGDIFIGKK